MQLKRHSWLALCLFGLPLLLGNKGCDADLHGLDSGAEQEDEDPSATLPRQDDGAPSVADAASPGAPAPTPVPKDAAVVVTPARDAGVTPVRDAGTGGGLRCGTRGGAQCAANEYCDFAAGTQCGAADQGGTCKVKPEVCTAIYKPVCGCDGKTYGSDCSAHGAGVSVASEGECGKPTPDPKPDAGAGKMCGGFAGLSCSKGQFCNYEIAAGGQGCEGIADGAGVCQTTPQACTLEYAPVCGCDHRTYGTACAAHAAGMSVLHTGACTEVDCKAIGGRAVDGIGPAPKCASGETDFGAIVYASGQISIEGTICCVK